VTAYRQPAGRTGAGAGYRHGYGADLPPIKQTGAPTAIPSRTGRRFPTRRRLFSGLIAALILLAYTKFNPFSNPYELHAGFNDARNIGVGAQVRIAGVEVGRVSGLEANGEGAATVTMELNDDALPIHRALALAPVPGRAEASRAAVLGEMTIERMAGGLVELYLRVAPEVTVGTPAAAGG